jgi:hypothetical protein
MQNCVCFRIDAYRIVCSVVRSNKMAPTCGPKKINSYGSTNCVTAAYSERGRNVTKKKYIDIEVFWIDTACKWIPTFRENMCLQLRGRRFLFTGPRRSPPIKTRNHARSTILCILVDYFAILPVLRFESRTSRIQIWSFMLKMAHYKLGAKVSSFELIDSKFSTKLDAFWQLSIDGSILLYLTRWKSHRMFPKEVIGTSERIQPC